MMNQLASTTLRRSSLCFRRSSLRFGCHHTNSSSDLPKRAFRQSQWTRNSTVAAPTTTNCSNITNATVASINTTSQRSLQEVQTIALSAGVRLTPNELILLQKKLTEGGFSNLYTHRAIEAVGNKALKDRTTREICLSVICNDANHLDRWGVYMINFFDYAGTALFAMVGTLVAGDHGMNLIGCGLVGCVAALGGGSLNAMLYGGASPLLGAPGVRWVANPSYLLTALAASFFTFFSWPYYCQYQAEHYLSHVIGEENLNEEGNVDKEVFMAIWNSNADFRRSIQDALPKFSTRTKRFMYEHIDDGNMFFDYLDVDGSGDLDLDELKKLIQHRFYNGIETYTLDTLGLSSLSIAAVVLAIRLGLHPVIAATSGVTVCFGGILRDLLVGRNIALGSQSYAGGTGLCSLTYVCLRELAVRRIWVLPMGVRAVLSAGSCCALRAYEYHRGRPLLRPMHDRSVGKHDNHKDDDDASLMTSSFIVNRKISLTNDKVARR